MRELSVYYCPKCGYYAYYQLSPKCRMSQMRRFHEPSPHEVSGFHESELSRTRPPFKQRNSQTHAYSRFTAFSSP